VPLRALVIQHEQSTPGGYVFEWLDDRGAEQDVFRIDVESRDVTASDHDLVVSLGSEAEAFDDSIPWIERESSVRPRQARPGGRRPRRPGRSDAETRRRITRGCMAAVRRLSAPRRPEVCRLIVGRAAGPSRGMAHKT
jgi:hypothetical protein